MKALNKFLINFRMSWLYLAMGFACGMVGFFDIFGASIVGFILVMFSALLAALENIAEAVRESKPAVIFYSTDSEADSE